MQLKWRGISYLPGKLHIYTSLMGTQSWRHEEVIMQKCSIINHTNVGLTVISDVHPLAT